MHCDVLLMNSTAACATGVGEWGARIGKGLIVALFSAQMAGCSGVHGFNSACSQEVTYAMTALVTFLAILTAMLAKQNRRYWKTRIDVQRQYAEITHAARLALVGEITASITHEVTQPLSAILNNIETAEILLRRPEPDLALLREILADVRK